MSKGKLIILLSLTLSLASGSFDLDEYLERDFANKISNEIKRDEISRSYLTFAKSRGIASAYQFSIQFSEYGTTKWLEELKFLAKSNANSAYQLGSYYSALFESQLKVIATRKHEQAAKEYLNLANQFNFDDIFIEPLPKLAFFYHGYIEKQALQSTLLAQAKFWFVQAQRLNHTKATLQLSAIDILEQKFSQAKQRLLAEQPANSKQANHNQKVNEVPTISRFEQEPRQTHAENKVDTVQQLLIVVVASALGEFEHSAQLNNQLKNVLPINENAEINRRGQQTDLVNRDIQNKQNSSVSTSCEMANFAENTQANVQQLMPNTVTFFGGTLADLFHLTRVIRELNLTANADTLASLFCFNDIRYMPLAKVKCQAQGESAIQCDEARLAELLEPQVNKTVGQKTTQRSNLFEQPQKLSSRYLAFLLPEGGANVNRGILYFDRNDEIEVLHHELSHFLGFADEYALSDEHMLCSGTDTSNSEFEINNDDLDNANDLTQSKNAMALNLVLPPATLIKALKNYSNNEGERKAIRNQLLKTIPWRQDIKVTTPLLDMKDGSWRIGTPEKFKEELGLFAAKTCHNKSYFKPYSARSLLEYYQAPLPALYLKLAKKNMSLLRMPSFDYNFALAQASIANFSELENSASDYQYWLIKALANERLEQRKVKIKQAKF